MTLRRDFLAFTAGAVAARTVLPAVAETEGDFTMKMPSNGDHPDAALLAVCAEFDMWERRLLATDFQAESGTPAACAARIEQERCLDAQDPLVARMCDLRAVTLEGQRARARSLALWDPELMRPFCPDAGDYLVAAIVRDLLAGEGEV